MSEGIAREPRASRRAPVPPALDELTSSYFAGADPEILAGALTRETAVAIGRELTAKRHPHALCSFIFGSAAEGRFRRHSDLDMIVVEANCDFVGTSRLVHGGCPVELHQFSRRAILHALQCGRMSGSYNVAFGLADSLIVVDASGLGAELKELARMVLRNGPPPIDRRSVRNLYRSALLWISELSANRNSNERFAVIAALYPVVMNLHLRANGCWTKGHKWAVRDAPHFSRRLTEALAVAHQTGSTDGLVELLAELGQVLEPQAWVGTDVEFQAAASLPGDHSAS